MDFTKALEYKRSCQRSIQKMSDVYGVLIEELEKLCKEISFQTVYS